MYSTFELRIKTLNHLFLMHPFSNPWKHYKTIRFSNVFRVQRKCALGTNALITLIRTSITSEFNVTHLALFLWLKRSFSQKETYFVKRSSFAWFLFLWIFSLALIHPWKEKTWIQDSKSSMALNKYRTFWTYDSEHLKLETVYLFRLFFTPFSRII